MKNHCMKDCVRCDGCGSSSFSPREVTCSTCGGRGEVISHDDSEVCGLCCEHGDICEDERVFLDCNQDMTQWFAARAESACEGDR